MRRSRSLLRRLMLQRLILRRSVSHQRARRLLNVSCAALMTVPLAPTLLYAHGSENHDDSGVSVVVDKEPQATVDASILPDELANIGGPFNLTNHQGESVSDKTYAGKHMLVFFGYSNCQVMCSISLKRIAEALNILQADADAPLDKFHSLVITVDPANDTPERLKTSLAAYHPSITGLTGTLKQLEPVYKAYKQKPAVLDIELNGSPVVEHQSYFYLMGPDGKLQTLFPPILSAESMAGVIKKYLPT